MGVPLDRHDTVQRTALAVAQHGSLNAALRADPTLPALSTLASWALEEGEQGEAYRSALTRARASAAHTLAERSLTVLDDVTILDAKGDVARVSLAKAKSESYRWLAERWNREAYGQAPQVLLDLAGASLTLAHVLPQGAPGAPPVAPTQALEATARPSHPPG